MNFLKVIHSPFIYSKPTLHYISHNFTKSRYISKTFFMHLQKQRPKPETWQKRGKYSRVTNTLMVWCLVYGVWENVCAYYYEKCPRGPHCHNHISPGLVPTKYFLFWDYLIVPQFWHRYNTPSICKYLSERSTDSLLVPFPYNTSNHNEFVHYWHWDACPKTSSAACRRFLWIAYSPQYWYKIEGLYRD